MEWSVDPNSTATFGNQSGSLISWYNAARKTRQNLDNVARDNNWSDETKAQQDTHLAQYMAALKNGDNAAAADAYRRLDPSVKRELNREQTQIQRRFGTDSLGVNENNIQTDDFVSRIYGDNSSNLQDKSTINDTDLANHGILSDINLSLEFAAAGNSNQINNSTNSQNLTLSNSSQKIDQSFDMMG